MVLTAEVDFTQNGCRGSGSGDERSDIVDESTDLGFEVAVADREARPLMPNDLTGEFEGTDRLNEDIEPYLRTQFREFALRREAGSRTRDIQERAGPLAVAGRAEGIELGSEAWVIAAIQWRSPAGGVLRFNRPRGAGA